MFSQRQQQLNGNSVSAVHSVHRERLSWPLSSGQIDM